MSYYDESYTNPRKRRPLPKYRPAPAPSKRRTMAPELRKRDRLLALAQAQDEMRLAEKAKREGNHMVAAMILRSVKANLAYAEGKPYKPTRTRAQRPGTFDAELRNTRRRLDLVQAQQN